MYKILFCKINEIHGSQNAVTLKYVFLRFRKLLTNVNRNAGWIIPMNCFARKYNTGWCTRGSHSDNLFICFLFVGLFSLIIKFEKIERVGGRISGREFWHFFVSSASNTRWYHTLLLFAKQIPNLAAVALSRENTKLTEFALSAFIYYWTFYLNY